MASVVNTELIVALAKALIAVSWADGELTPDEILNMKETLGRIRNLPGHDWLAIEMYIEEPVDAAERGRLIAELRELIQTPEDRALVDQALASLLANTDQVTTEEQQAIDGMKAAIDGKSGGSFGRLSRLLRGSSSSAPADAPNRETHLDDFIKNRVYFAASQRLERGEADVSFNDAQLRKLSLAGGMMAKVAAANPQITDREHEVMVDTLQEHWNLSGEEATFVTDVALSQLNTDLDNFRLADEFGLVTEYDEREQFIDMLFVVAAADGAIAPSEQEEIRILSDILTLPRRRFYEAMQKALPPAA